MWYRQISLAALQTHQPASWAVDIAAELRRLPPAAKYNSRHGMLVCSTWLQTHD